MFGQALVKIFGEETSAPPPPHPERNWSCTPTVMKTEGIFQGPYCEAGFEPGPLVWKSIVLSPRPRQLLFELLTTVLIEELSNEGCHILLILNVIAVFSIVHNEYMCEAMFPCIILMQQSVNNGSDFIDKVMD